MKADDLKEIPNNALRMQKDIESAIWGNCTDGALADVPGDELLVGAMYYAVTEAADGGMTDEETIELFRKVQKIWRDSQKEKVDAGH